MDLIDQYYPNFRDVGYFFKQYLAKYITPESRILDVGCGRKAFGEEYYKIAKWRVGVDADEAALASNQLMNEKIPGEAENLPEFSEKFDVVAAQWVLEHVKDPDKVIKKIAQNTKSGGHFLFMTTNLYSPLILTSKFFPTIWKKFLKHRLLGIPEDETYPTFYRINTPAKLDYYLTKNGFKKIDVKLIGVLTYFSINKPVLFTKAFLDRTLFDRFKMFAIFNTHIVGVYEKI